MAGSKEYVLEGVSRTVPDHEVQMGQREGGGHSRWQKGCAKAWRLETTGGVQRAGHGLEGMNQKDSHGGDQVRKDFGDCGEGLRPILGVIWREEKVLMKGHV